MIRRLEEKDAEAYAKLRRESLLAEPLAFASSPEDDIARSGETMRELLLNRNGSLLLGAFKPELVGALGLYRDRHAKAAHKVHIWGMYVTGRSRRQGIAAALLEAVLDHARSMSGVSSVHLCVSSAAPAAKRLYERAGFQVWGAEPDALRVGGVSASEDHMILRFD
jgi:RimJ/RimL family protein N-acetyltransferase